MAGDGTAVVVVLDPVMLPCVVVVVAFGPSCVVVVDFGTVVVVVVGGGTGRIAGIGGFLHTCIALGTAGCATPGNPDPKAMRTFLVI